MTAQSSRPRKHIPQRTCVACRKTLAKRALIRLVRRPDGVYIDPTGKMAGRGAYLHDQRSCWQRALQGDLLAKALRTRLTPADRDRLQTYMLTLPESPTPSESTGD